MGGATADVEEEDEVEEVEEEVVAAVVEEEEVVFFDFEAALPMILVARTRPAIGVTRRAAERMMEKCIFFSVSQLLGCDQTRLFSSLGSHKFFFRRNKHENNYKVDYKRLKDF
jgi:hypothetical protein